MGAGVHGWCCKDTKKRTRIALCLRLPGATVLTNALSSSTLVLYLQHPRRSMQYGDVDACSCRLSRAYPSKSALDLVIKQALTGSMVTGY